AARLRGDPLVADALVLRPAQERHRQPRHPVVDLDAVAVLEVLRLVLHVVDDDEDVGAGELVEVAEPGQVGGLVGSQDHRAMPPEITVILWGAAVLPELLPEMPPDPSAPGPPASRAITSGARASASCLRSCSGD